jgi:hypothetical protein
LANDSDLKFAMAATSNYEFDAWITCTALGNNSTDCKITFTVPAGATIRWIGRWQIEGGVAEVLFAATTGSGTTQVINIDAGVTVDIQIRGVVTTAGTAGDLQFQFAPNTTAVGRTTTIKADSFLKIGKF